MSKRKPVIGVSGSIMIMDGGMFPGYKKSYVNNDYITSVVKCGGVPYVVPMVDDQEVIEMQCEQLDALILSGGHDVDTLLWGEEPGRHLGDTMPARDTFDIALYNTMKKMGKPILGICRGCQLINVIEGGDIHQDLTLFEGSYIKHWQGHTPALKTHTAEFAEGSRIRSILGVESSLVNSFHHLALRKIGDDFKVTAKAKDGIPECIENKGEQFIMGCQFHPEMLTAANDEMFSKIFVALIEEAAKNI